MVLPPTDTLCQQSTQDPSQNHCWQVEEHSFPAQHFTKLFKREKQPDKKRAPAQYNPSQAAMLESLPLQEGMQWGQPPQ